MFLPLPILTTHSRRRNRLTDLVSQIMGEGTARATITVARAVVELLPRIQAFSDGLHALVRVNRAVYMQPMYNQLIQKSAMANERTARASLEQGGERAAAQQALLAETLAMAKEVITLMNRFQARVARQGGRM